MEIVGFDNLPENIKAKLVITDGHWLWTGANTGENRKDKKGRVRFNGKMEYPHRVVFHLLAGYNLNSLYQVNHVRECPYSLCCNPNCLYEGTQRDNVEDSIALKHNKELNKTKCPRCGGKYSLSLTTGHRYCQRCKNLRRDIWRNQNK